MGTKRNGPTGMKRNEDQTNNNGGGEQIKQQKKVKKRDDLHFARRIRIAIL